jgi:hypothetical protein
MWLQSYGNEYAWRYNRLYRDGHSMFAELLGKPVVVTPYTVERRPSE